MKTKPFVFAALLVALSSTAYAADVPITDDARAHFVAGVNLLKDPEGARYEDAYREFKAAYASSPSFKILGNLGLCAMKLERDGEAIDAYTKYLAQAGKDLDPGEKKQIETDLATLKAGVYRVSISVNPANLTINDSRVSARGDRLFNAFPVAGDKLELGVRSGHHVMVARATGYDDQTWEFDATPGGKDSHTFNLKKSGSDTPPPPPTSSGAVPPATATGTQAPPPVETERRVPTSVYVGAGITGALLIGGSVTGILALGKHSDFEKKNDGTDPAGAQSAKDSGKSLDLITDILLGGAVVGMAITTVLYVSRPEEPVQKGATIRLSPSVSSTGGGLMAIGRF